MSVLGNLRIRQGIKDGTIVCHPFVDDHVKGTSVDVTLGEWYYETRSPDNGSFSFDLLNLFGSNPFGGDFYQPFTEAGVKSMFGEPKRALPTVFEGREDEIYPISGIPADHPVIILQPRARILAHTHEFIGIRNGTSEMRARSSWGRNGIGVCLCAGWGDPGFVNRWAMEIQNFNDFPVPLPVGERVAQIIFHDVQGLDSDYSAVKTSKYQMTSDLQEIIRDWKPESLLPKSYKDKRVLPLPV